LLSQLVAVVAAVCPELSRHEATTEQLINKRQKVPPLVLVAGADPDRKRRPGRVDG
jgi:hypothetical protein